MTQNQINYWKTQYEHLDRMRSQKENERANLIYEAETKRHNLESELIGLKQAQASLASAAAATRNAIAAERNAATNEYIARLDQTRKSELQGYNIRQAQSEIDYRNAQTAESLARTSLYVEQTTTEASKRASYDAQSVRNLVGAGTDVVSAIGSIISRFAR